MMLTRSTDLSIVSLTNFNQFDIDYSFFSVKAWSASVDNFGMPYQVNDKLNQGMNQYFTSIGKKFYELISITFVGNC